MIDFYNKDDLPYNAKWKYQLTKLSKEGFQFNTNSLDHIHDLLVDFVCEACIIDLKDEGITLDKDMPVEEKLIELVSTACGCEFCLSVPEDEEFKFMGESDA